MYVPALLPEPGLSVNDQLRRGDRMLLPEFRSGLARQGDVERWVDFDVYWSAACPDCSAAVARERFARSRAQAVRAYRDLWPLAALADVPSRYVLCADDRLMDNAFWAPAVRDRLGVEPLVMPGDHAPMAARSEQLVELIV